MNPFVWKDHYSLGRPDIDGEHRALFRMAEQFHDAMSNGTSQDQLAGLFARLASYARFHFANEEGLMQKTGYPEHTQHRQEHESFTARCSLLERQLHSQARGLDEATLAFLRSWLEQHVCGSDQRFALYLAQQQERAAVKLG